MGTLYREQCMAQIETDLGDINGEAPYDIKVAHATRDGITPEEADGLPLIVMSEEDEAPDAPASNYRLHIGARVTIYGFIENDSLSTTSLRASTLCNQLLRNIFIAMVGAANRTHSSMVDTTHYLGMDQINYNTAIIGVVARFKVDFRTRFDDPDNP